MHESRVSGLKLGDVMPGKMYEVQPMLIPCAMIQLFLLLPWILRILSICVLIRDQVVHFTISSIWLCSSSDH